MRKLFAVMAVTVLATLSLTTAVLAASPHQVDPAGMTPPLNPDYDPWICTDVGAGPICRASLDQAWSNEDTGLTCDGRSIYATGHHEQQAVRWHLPDGRATRTFFKNTSAEVWTLSPTGDGPSVSVRGSWNLHYVYPDPGDRSTRVLTITGADWQVTAKGTGLVFHDTGLVRFVAGGDDEIALTHGPTDSDHGNLDLVLPDVCAALGA